MSLTAALDNARSSLMASGIQSSVISRNIAGASQAGYSRKLTALESMPGAGAVSYTHLTLPTNREV